MFIFPLTAALVSLVFSSLVFKQYAEKERPFHLAWAIALLLFSIASFAETVGVVFGWSEILVKIWYLFGGVLVVGYLALGSLYINEPKVASRLLILATLVTALAVLPMIIFNKTAVGSAKVAPAVLFGALFVGLIAAALKSERIAAVWGTVLAAGTVGGLIMTVLAPIDPTLLSEGWESIDRSLYLKGTAVTFNTLGGVILIAGALYSGWVLWRKKALRERAVGTLLIGIGAIFPSIGGYLHGYFQAAQVAVLSVSLTIGIIIMFIGFLETGKPVSAAAEPTPAPTVGVGS